MLVAAILTLTACSFVMSAAIRWLSVGLVAGYYLQGGDTFWPFIAASVALVIELVRLIKHLLRPPDITDPE